MDAVLVEHRQPAVLGDPLDVVVVRRLVDERPDREARHGGHRRHEQRRELDGDERPQRSHAQRPKNARSDSAIQSIIGSLRPG